MQVRFLPSELKFKTMEKIVTVLESDFENNDYLNTNENMKGCPLQRAFMRAGLVKEGEFYMVKFNFYSVDEAVDRMFLGLLPKKDFEFVVITKEEGPHECIFEGNREIAVPYAISL